jgi:hypothetical protein
MKCKLALLALWLLAGYSLNGQSVSSEIIRSAEKDSAYVRQLQRIQLRKSLPQTIKWLDRIELRSQTDDFILTQEQYGLRFMAAKPSEIKYRKKLEIAEQNFLEVNAEYARHQAIIKRYQYLLDRFELYLEAKWARATLAILEKRNEYLEGLFSLQLDADVRDLIQSFKKKQSESSRWEQIAGRQAILADKYSMPPWNNSDTSAFQQWISIMEIKNLLESEVPGPVPTDDKYARLLFEQERESLRLQEIKQSKWDVLEFVQARWQNRPNDQLFREKFAIGAGFILPYSGSRQKDKNESAYTTAGIAMEEAEYKQNFNLKKLELRQKILQEIELYEKEHLKKINFESKFHPVRLAQSPLVNPQDILYLQESIIDWEKDLSEQQISIYTRYIDYLDHCQWVSKRPLRNYLSTNTPVIE